jgi:hypothetical protein
MQLFLEYLPAIPETVILGAFVGRWSFRVRFTVTVSVHLDERSLPSKCDNQTILGDNSHRFILHRLGTAIG